MKRSRGINILNINIGEMVKMEIDVRCYNMDCDNFQDKLVKSRAWNSPNTSEIILICPECDNKIIFKFSGGKNK